MTLQAAPPHWQRRVIAVAACRFTEAVAIGMLIPTLPSFIAQLQAPSFPGRSAEELTAILFSATGFSMAGIQLLSMRVSDLFDRRKIFIIGGLGGAALCGTSYCVIDTYGQLLAMRIVQGVFLGFTFPALMAILSFLAPPGHGGRTLAIYSTIRLLGFASGPWVGGVLTEQFGFDTTFFTSASLLMLSAVAVAIWVPDFREKRSPGNAAPKVRNLDRMFPVLGSCIVVMMIGITAIISLFPYYEREWKVEPDELGLLYGVFVATRCLCQYFMGWLGDRIDKKNLLLMALVALIPLVALQGFCSAMTQLLVLRLLLGVVSSAISTSVNGIAADRAESGMRATIMGINTFSFSLGIAVGPLLGGFLPEGDNLAPVFLWPAGLAVGVLLAVALWVTSDREWQRTRGASAQHALDEVNDS